MFFFRIVTWFSLLFSKRKVFTFCDLFQGSITYIFPCKQWLARNEGDGAIERELTASKLVEQTARTSGKVEKREIVTSGTLRKKTLKISVVTGDKFGCGTDANIFLTLIGDRGDSGERKLVNSETHKDKFERGNVSEACHQAVEQLEFRHLVMWFSAFFRPTFSRGKWWTLVRFKKRVSAATRPA